MTTKYNPLAAIFDEEEDDLLNVFGDPKPKTPAALPNQANTQVPVQTHSGPYPAVALKPQANNTGQLSREELAAYRQIQSPEVMQQMRQMRNGGTARDRVRQILTNRGFYKQPQTPVTQQTQQMQPVSQQPAARPAIQQPENTIADLPGGELSREERQAWRKLRDSDSAGILQQMRQMKSSHNSAEDRIRQLLKNDGYYDRQNAGKGQRIIPTEKWQELSDAVTPVLNKRDQDSLTTLGQLQRQYDNWQSIPAAKALAENELAVREKIAQDRIAKLDEATAKRRKSQDEIYNELRGNDTELDMQLARQYVENQVNAYGIDSVSPSIQAAYRRMQSGADPWHSKTAAAGREDQKKQTAADHKVLMTRLDSSVSDVLKAENLTSAQKQRLIEQTIEEAEDLVESGKLKQLPQQVRIAKADLADGFIGTGQADKKELTATAAKAMRNTAENMIFGQEYDYDPLEGEGPQRSLPGAVAVAQWKNVKGSPERGTAAWKQAVQDTIRGTQGRIGLKKAFRRYAAVHSRDAGGPDKDQLMSQFEAAIAPYDLLTDAWAVMYPDRVDNLRQAVTENQQVVEGLAAAAPEMEAEPTAPFEDPAAKPEPPGVQANADLVQETPASVQTNTPDQHKWASDVTQADMTLTDQQLGNRVTELLYGHITAQGVAVDDGGAEPLTQTGNKKPVQLYFGHLLKTEREAAKNLIRSNPDFAGMDKAEKIEYITQKNDEAASHAWENAVKTRVEELRRWYLKGIDEDDYDGIIEAEQQIAKHLAEQDKLMSEGEYITQFTPWWGQEQTRGIGRKLLDIPKDIIHGTKPEVIAWRNRVENESETFAAYLKTYKPEWLEGQVERGIIGETVSGIGRGIVGLVDGMGSLGEMISSSFGGDWGHYAHEGGDMFHGWMDSATGSKVLKMSNSAQVRKGGVNYWLGRFGEAVPSLAVTVATSGAAANVLAKTTLSKSAQTAIRQAVTTAVSGGIAAGQSYRDIRTKLLDSGMDWRQADKVAGISAMSIGVVSGFLETIGADSALHGSDVVRNRLVAAASAAISEGSTEYLQEAVAWMGTVAAGIDEPFDHDAALEAFAIGCGLGGGLDGIHGRIKSVNAQAQEMTLSDSTGEVLEAMRNDALAALGVDATASLDEITAARDNLAKQDGQKDKAQWAYEVLKSYEAIKAETEQEGSAQQAEVEATPEPTPEPVIEPAAKPVETAAPIETDAQPADPDEAASGKLTQDEIDKQRADARREIQFWENVAETDGRTPDLEKLIETAHQKIQSLDQQEMALVGEMGGQSDELARPETAKTQTKAPVLDEKAKAAEKVVQRGAEFYAEPEAKPEPVKKQMPLVDKQAGTANDSEIRELQNELAGLAKDSIDGLDQRDMAAGEVAGDQQYGHDHLPTQFSGPLPTELKQALSGKPHLRFLLKANAGRGEGSDAVGNLGADEYVRRLETIAAGDKGVDEAALKTAREMAAGTGDLETQLKFLRLDALTDGEAKPAKQVRVATFLPGDSFAVGGKTFNVTGIEPGIITIEDPAGDYSGEISDTAVLTVDDGSMALASEVGRRSGRVIIDDEAKKYLDDGSAKLLAWAEKQGLNMDVVVKVNTGYKTLAQAADDYRIKGRELVRLVVASGQGDALKGLRGKAKADKARQIAEKSIVTGENTVQKLQGGLDRAVILLHAGADGSTVVEEMWEAWWKSQSPAVRKRALRAGRQYAQSINEEWQNDEAWQMEFLAGTASEFVFAEDAAIRSGHTGPGKGLRAMFQQTIETFREYYDAFIQRVRYMRQSIREGVISDDLADVLRGPFKNGLKRRLPNGRSEKFRSDAVSFQTRGKPVVKITGKELGDFSTIKSLRRASRDYFNENIRGKKIRNIDDGRVILLSSFKKASSGITKYDAEAMKSVVKLPEIIKNAKYLYSEQDTKGRFNVKAWHYYGSTIEIDSKLWDVKIRVREDNNGHLYYYHDLSKITEPVSTSGGELQNADNPVRPITDSVNNIIGHKDGKVKSDEDISGPSFQVRRRPTPGSAGTAADPRSQRSRDETRQYNVLKLKLQAEARGQREGYRLGRNELQENHRRLINIVRDHLPRDKQGAMLDSINRAKTPGELDKTKQRIWNHITRYNKTFARQQAMERLDKTLVEIGHKGRKKSTLRPEFQRKVVDLFDGIRTKGISNATRKRFQEIAQFGADHPEMLNRDLNDPDSPYSPAFHKVYEKAVHALGAEDGQLLRDMDPESIDALNTAIQGFIRQSELKDQIEILGRVRNEQEVTDKALDQLDKAGKKAEYKPDMSKAVTQQPNAAKIASRWFWDMQDTPENISLFLGVEENSPSHQIFYQGLAEGRRQYLQITQMAEDHIRQIMDDYQFRDVKEMVKLSQSIAEAEYGKGSKKAADAVEMIDIDLPTAKFADKAFEGKLSLTAGELIELYNLIDDPDTLDQILNENSGGITLARTARETSGGKGIVLGWKDVVAIRQAMAARPELESIAVAMKTWINSEMAERLNKQWEKAEGWQIATSADYWPRRRNMKALQTEGDDPMAYVGDITLQGQGIFQERTGGRQPIAVGDGFNTYVRHISNTARYVAFYEPVRTAKRMLNNPKYSRSLAYRLGEGFLTRMRKYVDDVAGLAKPNTADADKLANKVRTGMYKATLALNLKVMMKQIPSYIGARTELVMKDWLHGAKYLPANLAPKKWSKYVAKIGQEMTEHSPFMRSRFEGGGMAVLGPTASGNALKEFYSGKKADWTMEGIAKFDFAAVGAIWQAAKHEVRRTQPKLKVGSKQYWDAVARRHEMVVARTQPSYETHDRPGLARQANKSAVAAAVTMYSSQRAQNVAMARRSLWARKHGLISVGEFIMRAASLTFSAVLGIKAIDDTADWVMRGGKPDRRKDRPSIKGSTLELLESVVGNFYGGGEVISIARGRSAFDLPVTSFTTAVSRAWMAATSDLADPAKIIKSGKYKGMSKRQAKWLRIFENTIEAIAMLKGIPYSGPKQVIRTAVNTANPDSEGYGSDHVADELDNILTAEDFKASSAMESILAAAMKEDLTEKQAKEIAIKQLVKRRTEQGQGFRSAAGRKNADDALKYLEERKRCGEIRDRLKGRRYNRRKDGKYLQGRVNTWLEEGTITKDQATAARSWIAKIFGVKR